MFNLKGKTAIITGASGFLGKSMCEALLQYNCNIEIYGRGLKMLKFAENLQDRYRRNKVSARIVDLYNEKEFKEQLKESIKDNKKIDILINNAFDFSKDTGFNDNSGRFENMNKEIFMKGMESGLYWAFLATQIIGEQMKKQKSGSIINISSMYGHVSPDPLLYEETETFNPPIYSIVKSGLFGLTKYTASFYGKYNIRCNSISPGAFPNTTGENKPNEKILDRLIKKIPLGRVGNPEDLKGAIIFLASDASEYVTGTDIKVDGGFAII